MNGPVLVEDRSRGVSEFQIACCHVETVNQSVSTFSFAPDVGSFEIV